MYNARMRALEPFSPWCSATAFRIVTNPGTQRSLCQYARVRTALVRLLSLVAFVSFAGCGPAVDLTKGLQVTIVNTGWFDVGIVNGQNKLVPSISFTLKNVSVSTRGVKPGLHTVTVTAVDASGRTARRVFRFTICKPKPKFTG